MGLSGALRAPGAPLVEQSRSARQQQIGSRTAVRGGRRQSVAMAAAYQPPAVSATKQKFLEEYPRPVPAIYNTVVQELLIQQHFIRYNVAYKYDEIFALGLTSAFDQILEGFPSNDREKLFSAYIKSLDEDPRRYRSDAAALEKACEGLQGVDSVVPSQQGSNMLQKKLADIASRAADGKFFYSKFFAVGLFRLLELTGVKEPQALGEVVGALNIDLESVNADLKLYKGILTKLSAAKELMQEFLEREKRKAQERAEAAPVESDAPVSQ
ncbi:unnamed protein product [Ostreobium quekettii]|uniref:Uncharacterized protein n=1 Tax=Ostreobium quekettii TaxID=121088 RepID=A0A8S1JFN0_9CHLO|nr:unnamed protein product [Ostreobium quekettii]|eukprot:evm.model.scf_132.3 EVM.evm.TU.scf_132.3   scf_132:36078-37839(+)